MPVQDFINRYAMSAGYTNKLSGLAFIPISGLPAASGTVDWYTCPAGKRAAVMGISYCSPSGSASIAPMLKSGGNYYNLNSTQTATAIGVGAGGIVGCSNPKTLACSACLGSRSKQFSTNCLYLLNMVPFKILSPP